MCCITGNVLICIVFFPSIFTILAIQAWCIKYMTKQNTLMKLLLTIIMSQKLGQPAVFPGVTLETALLLLLH